MADIKLEPQETNHFSQDSLLGPISPLQEHKSGVSLSYHNILLCDYLSICMMFF